MDYPALPTLQHYPPPRPSRVAPRVVPMDVLSAVLVSSYVLGAVF